MLSPLSKWRAIRLGATLHRGSTVARQVAATHKTYVLVARPPRLGRPLAL